MSRIQCKPVTGTSVLRLPTPDVVHGRLVGIVSLAQSEQNSSGRQNREERFTGLMRCIEYLDKTNKRMCFAVQSVRGVFATAKRTRKREETCC